MDEREGESRRGRWPWGLLGMLGLVLLVEGFIARRTLDFTDTGTLSWRLGAEAVAREAPRCEVLCLGDSLVKHGLLPRVIEARSGRRAYNFAFAGGTPPATYFMLRRALEAGARPAAVLVDFKPNTLVNHPRNRLRQWQEFASFRECLDLAWTARSAHLLTATAMGRLFPSVRARYEIRAHILAALRGGPAPLRETNAAARRNWLVNGGANVAPANRAFRGELGSDFRWRTWSCHRVQAAYVRRFLALAEAHGIRVDWLLPPFLPELMAARERSGAEAGYLGFVRAMQSRHPNVTVLDARHAGYEQGVFVDATHLDYRGAYALSWDVAEAVRASLPSPADGPGWITLPRYRERPIGVPLEDVDQSRLAVLPRDAVLRR